MSLITLTTDFGSVYPAAMKGVILAINPQATIVDISHNIPHTDIRAGAFALYSVVPYFPNGTVHIAVVDPGVGTERNSIVISAGGQFFVGPDNGLMVPAAARLEDMEIYKITNSGLSAEISATFHGRDIFARIGAYLSKGMTPEDFGVTSADYVHLDFGTIKVKSGTISGEVIYIDDFGNIITNIPAANVLEIAGFGNKVHIFDRDMPFMQTYGQVPERGLLALIGSHGFLEVAINRGNASAELSVRTADPVYLVPS